MSPRSTRGSSAERAEGPAADPGALARYRGLVLLRALDAAGAALDAQADTGIHLPLAGLEAVLVGAAAALKPVDWVLPGPRQSAIAVARGLGLGAWFAQALGRAADPARGRQAPHHGSFRSVRVVSASSPIGSQLVHAVGVARAMKRAGRGEVAVALAGQAAVATGDFHCALNFASVQDVPAVFLLTSDDRLGDHTATDGIALKAEAYGLPGVSVDGGDAEAVRDVVADACDRARAGGGPTLIEATVCSPPPDGPLATSAPGPRPVRAPWAQSDPVARQEERLTSAGLLPPEAVQDINQGAREAVAAAVLWATALPLPPGDTLFADVFARLTPTLSAQREEWRARHAPRQES